METQKVRKKNISITLKHASSKGASMGGVGKNSNDQEGGKQKQVVANITNNPGGGQKSVNRKKWKRLEFEKGRIANKKNTNGESFERRKRSHEATDMEIDTKKF